MADYKLANLSIEELLKIVDALNDKLDQKDREIDKLNRDAQEWVHKFDEHQNQVAEEVIKRFEMEFEAERNELNAKLAKLSQQNGKLITRYKSLQKLVSEKAEVKPRQAKKDSAQAAVSKASPAALDIRSRSASSRELELPTSAKKSLASL